MGGVFRGGLEMRPFDVSYSTFVSILALFLSMTAFDNQISGTTSREIGNIGRGRQGVTTVPTAINSGRTMR